MASQDARKVAGVLEENFPRKIEGKNAITEMKREGSRNWRQMEWTGWYTEEIALGILVNEIGGGRGKTVGKTEFDYKSPCGDIFDIKSHVKNKSNGGSNDWTILNDQSAIRTIIENEGSIGFVVISGKAEFDKNGEFKRWHDQLKGKKSDYVKQRENEGRPSRMRKSSIEFDEITIVEFDDLNDLQRGYEKGWLKDFNQGRNADGGRREPKYMMKIEDVSDEHISVKINLR